MNRLVGRVKTTRYMTSKGFAYKKEFIVLKRKSTISLNEVMVELDTDFPINFHEVPDGLYELLFINISHDWETGYADDWDVKLVEYHEDK